MKLLKLIFMSKENKQKITPLLEQRKFLKTEYLKGDSHIENAEIWLRLGRVECLILDILNDIGGN